MFNRIDSSLISFLRTQITGPTIGGVNATIVLSGTSPAAAYVAGLVALYISQVGNNPPAGISASLWSTYGVLSGIRMCDVGEVHRVLTYCVCLSQLQAR